MKKSIPLIGNDEFWNQYKFYDDWRFLGTRRIQNLNKIYYPHANHYYSFSGNQFLSLFRGKSISNFPCLTLRDSFNDLKVLLDQQPDISRLGCQLTINQRYLNQLPLEQRNNFWYYRYLSTSVSKKRRDNLLIILPLHLNIPIETLVQSVATNTDLSIFKRIFVLVTKPKKGQEEKNLDSKIDHLISINLMRFLKRDFHYIRVEDLLMGKIQFDNLKFVISNYVYEIVGDCFLNYYLLKMGAKSLLDEECFDDLGINCRQIGKVPQSLNHSLIVYKFSEN